LSKTFSVASRTDHRIAGDHLGHDEARTQPARQTPERRIRHARHGREQDPGSNIDWADLNAHVLGTEEIDYNIGMIH
jgi:hypothetical protein